MNFSLKIESSHIVRGIGIGVFCLGAMVLVGWGLDLPLLKSVLPGQVTMKANTAAGFVCAGLALVLTGAGAGTSGRHRFAPGFALLVAFLGVATLTQYFFAVDLGIDELLFRDSANAVATSHPGRMAPSTALAFVLCGSALAWLGLSRKALVAQVLALIVIGLSLLGLLGYLYGVSNFYQFRNLTAMAVHTAATFLLLGLGVLGVRIDTGMMRTFTGNTVGGMVARRLCGPAVGFPVVLGWLMLRGTRAGYFDEAMGLVLAIAATITMMVLIIWWTALWLERLDRERQLVENALRLTNEQLESRVSERTQAMERVSRLQRAVLDGTVFSVIATKPDGLIEIFNRGAEKMLGYQSAEVVGRLTPAIMHVEAEIVARATELSMEVGCAITPDFQVLVAGAKLNQAEEREWTYVRKDGSRLPVRLSMTALRDAAGAITGFLGIACDITESRKAESGREEVLNRLSKLGAQVPGLIYQFRLRPDGSSCFPYASEGIRQIYRLTPTEVETEASKVYAVLHPDDREVVSESILASARTLQPWQQEYRVRFDDGEVRWLLGSSVPEREADGSVLWHGFITDVTERKEAEQATYRALTELEQQKAALDQHALVAVTDVKGRIIHVNKKFCAVSQYRRDELLGKTHRLINSGHHPKEFFGEMYRTIADGKVWQAEVCNRAKDGSLYWVDTTVVPFMGPNKKPTHYIAIRTDITERKQLGASLAQARDQALEASRLKSEFLATMSHEIRTPMNAVIGMCTLLLDTAMSAEQREYTETIRVSGDALLTIINDILDFSRIEAGKMRVDPVEFDFNRLIEETVMLLASRAHEKRLELTCEILPWSGVRLLGDNGRVRQVLTNLIGNAIKFTDRGQVDVGVRAVRETEKRTRLRVSIRDTGIGIPLDAQARLFQPFVQADASTTRRFGGTGLGLAITRQLIELMGGEVGLESEEGQGSVFWFELEFTRCRATAADELFTLPTGKRALVVDDNETNRRIVLAQLEHLGVVGEAVSGGQAALLRLRDSAAARWDFVLLDWHMPGLNGVDLAAIMRADPKLADMPLIMLSSAGQLSASQSIEDSFAGFLTKPVTETQLKRCLHRVLSPATAADGEPERAATTPKRRGLHLLLVEDNLANQRVATLLLEKHGHQVELATNGLLALERLAAKDFDVVLMDCQMPVMDGYEATRRLRSGKLPGVNAKVPVIAMTAYARAEDRARCVGAGMDGYVAKPIREAELEAALECCGVANPSDAAVGVNVASDEAIFDQAALETTRNLPGIYGKSLLPEMVSLYLSEEQERLEQIALLASQRQAEMLAQEVHSFGGNAASFGGAQVRRIALEVEDAARAQHWPSVSERMGELHLACARLKAEIEKLHLAAP